MAARQRFPDRRSSFQVHLHHEGQDYHVGFSFFGFDMFDLGDVGEIFISSKKASSTAEVLGRDAAILASQALQRGATVEGLAASLTRSDSKGRRRAAPATLIGAALDLVARESRKIKAEMQPGKKAKGRAAE